MGVDIYTEKAVAVTVDEFVQKTCRLKKSRKAIAESLLHEELCGDEQAKLMIERSGFCRDWFGARFTEDLEGNEGYPENEDYHRRLVSILADASGVNLKKLPRYEIRMFESSRYSGYEVSVGVPYLMFDSHGLFEQRLSKKGKAIENELGIDVVETEWTVYSY